MKKICVKAATAAFCLAACGIGANVYAASTATVDFHGKIYMPTCDVTTDQSGNLVDLGKYSSDYFTAEGKDTVAKDFNVIISGCIRRDPNDGGELTDHVMISFEDNGTIDPVTGNPSNSGLDGRLNLTGDSTARGVGIRVQYRMLDGSYDDVFENDKVSTPITLDKLGLRPEQNPDPENPQTGYVLPMKAMMSSKTTNAGIQPGDVKGQMTITTSYK